MGSDFLFGHPSFTSGLARTLDLGGLYDDFNVSPTPQIADARALRADWGAVGQDLMRATKAVAKTISRRKRRVRS